MSWIFGEQNQLKGYTDKEIMRDRSKRETAAFYGVSTDKGSCTKSSYEETITGNAMIIRLKQPEQVEELCSKNIMKAMSD